MTWDPAHGESLNQRKLSVNTLRHFYFLLRGWTIHFWVLSQISCVKDSLKRLNQKMFLLGPERQMKSMTLPPGTQSNSSWPSVPVDTQSQECRGQRWPQLCSRAPSLGHRASGPWPWPSIQPQTPRLPHPSVWRGQEVETLLTHRGLSKWEARLFFPYITIIKNNHCCHWIFMLTTPGPDICIKISCRTLGKDFSTAAKLCKN